MKVWSIEELAALMRYTNAEVGDKRLAVNIERNGWDVRNPEREEV